jgi:Ala-tRNA(Pro) deacylase
MSDPRATLRDLGIPFEEYEHPAVFTVEESNAHCAHIPGGRSKNLFLRNEKGDRHYLVSVRGEKKVDLKKLRELLNERKLSFGSSERLMQKLGVTPGSVSVLGLVNNAEKDVIVILDQDLWNEEYIQYHPNINTATVVIPRHGLEKFLASRGNPLSIVRL